MQPAIKTYHIDDETEYRLKVIDTWNMTIEDRGFVKGRFTVELPGRPYMAIQLKKDSHLEGNLVQLVIILVTKKN